jgi:thiamine biosynthesis lipoprotein
VQEVKFRAMGSRMLALVDSDAPAAGWEVAQVPGWFAEWESRLSRFRADSELGQLNRYPGQPVRVSPILWDVVQVALQAAEHTQGLVTPTLLSALEAAGYDRSFQTINEAGPAAFTVMPGRAQSCDWRDVVCDARTRSICLPPGVRLDLGGFAKGWAADQAVGRLGQCAPALIDAGGDIAVSGPRADGQPWPVGVGDPRKPGTTLCVLKIAQGGVATSGRDYRRWQRDGIWQHHILDPRSARPAETDVLSATVIGRSAAEAEVATKAVLIQGSHAGLAWLEARPSLAGLLALEDGTVVLSSQMEDYGWS